MRGKIFKLQATPSTPSPTKPGFWLIRGLVKMKLTWLYSHYPFTLPYTPVTCFCTHNWILKHFSLKSPMISLLLTPLCHMTPLITSWKASLSLTSVTSQTWLFCSLFSFYVAWSSSVPFWICLLYLFCVDVPQVSSLVPLLSHSAVPPWSYITIYIPKQRPVSAFCKPYH